MHWPLLATSHSRIRLCVPAASCDLSIQVCDGAAPDLCDTELRTVSITAINDAPVISTTAGSSATEEVQYSYDADVDGAIAGGVKVGVQTGAELSIQAPMSVPSRFAAEIEVFRWQSIARTNKPGERRGLPPRTRRLLPQPAQARC